MSDKFTYLTRLVNTSTHNHLSPRLIKNREDSKEYEILLTDYLSTVALKGLRLNMVGLGCRSNKVGLLNTLAPTPTLTKSHNPMYLGIYPTNHGEKKQRISCRYRKPKPKRAHEGVIVAYRGVQGLEGHVWKAPRVPPLPPRSHRVLNKHPNILQYKKGIG